MITRVEIHLQTAEQIRIYPNFAYALYGELCARMEPALADTLHLCEITPLRQHLRRDEQPGQYVWVLDLFDQTASLVGLLQSMSVIHLDCCPAPLEVVECRVLQPVPGCNIQKCVDQPGAAGGGGI